MQSFSRVMLGKGSCAYIYALKGKGGEYEKEDFYLLIIIDYNIVVYM